MHPSHILQCVWSAFGVTLLQTHGKGNITWLDTVYIKCHPFPHHTNKHRILKLCFFKITRCFTFGLISNIYFIFHWISQKLVWIKLSENSLMHAGPCPPPPPTHTQSCTIFSKKKGGFMVYVQNLQDPAPMNTFP